MESDSLMLLFEDCTSADRGSAVQAITQLEHLIERHTMNKYGEEVYNEALAGREALLNKHLQQSDMASVTHFLFYLLFNFPDRSLPAARCLVKCYNKSLAEGICQAIEVYYLKDDETTCYLTDAITHSSSFEAFGDRVLDLFRKLKAEGLPRTQKLMATKFGYYSKFYGFAG